MARRSNLGFFERLRGPSTVSYRAELARRRKESERRRKSEAKERKLAAARERAVEREVEREAARRARLQVQEANRIKREMLAEEARERKREAAEARRRMSEEDREQERIFRQVQKEERAERRRRKKEREREGLGPGYEFDMNPTRKKRKGPTPKQRSVIHGVVFGRSTPTAAQREAVDKAIDSAYRRNPAGVEGAFQRCVRDVRARGGAYDPAAVCAAIGRAKYGQAEMTRRAVAGKRKAARRRRANPLAYYARQAGAGWDIIDRETGQVKRTVKTKSAARQVLASMNAKAIARRGNPEEGAAAMFEKFHGTPSTRVKEFRESVREHSYLAELGRLVYLVVKVGPGRGKFLDFTGKGVEVASSENGGQIYFVGGDASIDLKSVGAARELPKDHVELGECVEICYHTKKGFHKFEPIDYFHKFGKPGGFPPMLNYDVLNDRPYLSGGSYQVRSEGIVK